MTAAPHEGAVGDARKRHLTPTPGLPGYFVAGDAYGDPCVWRGTVGDPCPTPALYGALVERDDPELWAAIVAAVEGGGVRG